MRIGQEEEDAVLEVIRSKRLFRYYGPEPGPSRVAELEKAFAAHMGTTYGLAVTSGTGALICGLTGIGIGPGDEVIVPAYTWIASASAVFALGGVPIPAEVDESLTLDPADVERKITAHTKAIMPVHMRGAPCRMDTLMDVARKHNLKVIEDTAQADGGSFQGKRMGSIGDVGAFSLQFNKIITCGEGGMVITNSHDVFKRAVMFHDVIGGARNNIPEDEILPGVNFRMTELQAAVALAQLRKLDGLLEQMRQRKAMLKSSMADVAERKGVTFRKENDPQGDTAISLVFFLPEAERAHKIAKALSAEGAGAGVMHTPGQSDYHIYPYWSPIMNKRTWTPTSGPWRWHEGEVNYSPDMCPRTLELLGRAVHMDVSPDLTNDQVEEIAEALNKVLNALA
jgi:dTDP-4-amino-4,6-dideoxygalactose transaminase